MSIDAIWQNKDGYILQFQAFSYNNADMVAQIQRENGGSRQFGYDGLDRLVSEQSGGNTVQYDYDRSGNRTNQTVNGVDTPHTLGTGNRLLSFGASGFVSHDAAGNVTNIVYEDGRELAIEWNGKYQITAVSTNGVVAEEYGYDTAGRRAWIASGGTTNYMVYDGEDLVAEVDSSGEPVRSYVHGPGIDNLLAITTYGAETNTYYAFTDHLGTVTALADDAGAIVESYEYDAWGNVTVYDENDAVIPQSQYGNRFTFQGREYSWATGLYNFRARWYDPTTGRWLSKDPIGISGGLNQYVAFANNPINFVDPLGLDNLNPNSWGYGSVNNTVLSGVDSEGHTVGGGQLKGMVDTVVYGGAIEAGVFAGGYLAVQAWPTVAAAGPALYDKAQTAYYRAISWTPGHLVLDYPNSAPIRATIGEYLYNSAPYATSYAAGLSQAPPAPAKNPASIISDLAGQATYKVLSSESFTKSYSSADNCK